MTPVIGVPLNPEQDGFHVGMAYAAALERAGAYAVGLTLCGDIGRMIAALDRLDGLLLPGGTDVDPYHFGEDVLPENGWIEPERDRVELALARHALKSGMPLLAICRGVQVMNIAAGGDIYQDLYVQTGSRLQHAQRAPRWYPTQRVQLAPDSRLASVVGKTPLPVNTFHHQAVRQVGSGLRAVGHTSDGIVEAIEAPGHRFAVGVQWHPEAMVGRDKRQAALFQAFVAAAMRES